MPTVLEIRALAKRVHAGVPGCSATATLLRDVWLRVDAGERVAVAGASGAGRSALLLCACGLLRPDAGTVRRAGRAAFVPAAAPPLGGLTVAELLEWERRTLLARGDVAPRALDDALRAAECDALAPVRVRLLSPAAARRVALARALLARPALLAVDAPDDERADASAASTRVLARLAREGVAVVHAVTRVADAAGARIVVLPAHPPVTRRARRTPADDASGAAACRAVAERAPVAPLARGG